MSSSSGSPNTSTPPPPLSRVSWAWIAAFLAPAVIMAGVLLTRAPVSTDRFYAGTRGAVHLALIGPAGPLPGGATVIDGQALGVRLSVPKAGYLLVVGVDERGALEAYDPPSGGRSVSVTAMDGAQLPISLRVNGPSGAERIYALFTEHPVAVADVEAAIHAAHASAKDTQLPVHGAQSSVLIEKQIR